MSIAGSDTQNNVSTTELEDQDNDVTCEELLRYDEKQLVRYLKRRQRDEGFDVSNLVGVFELSESQRAELAEKISKATLLLPIRVDDLQARLQNVADNRFDDSRESVEASRSRSTSIAITPPPGGFHERESVFREELIRNGGRPVCTEEELLGILAAPMERYKSIQSWLSDTPDTEGGRGDLRTVFTRQFMRWWDFRKTQWDNRGLSDSTIGFSAYLEADRRVSERTGQTRWLNDPAFEDTNREMWKHMPVARRLAPSEDQTFTTYNNAVKMRLAPYRFTRSLQLRKDPQKQTVWTDWLEYLSFELKVLEVLTTKADAWEPRFQRSLKTLLTAPKQSENRIMAGLDIAPDLTPVSELEPIGGRVNKTKKPTASRIESDTNQQSIDNFGRDTKAYTKARKEAMYQRYRVDWVVKEARLMELETSVQKNSTTGRKRKKQHDEIPSEPLIPKRTRSGLSRREASASARSLPRTTRRSTHARRG